MRYYLWQNPKNMLKEKKITVMVKLTGNALLIVNEEQKRYEKKDIIRGKSKIINLLLSKLWKQKPKNNLIN